MPDSGTPKPKPERFLRATNVCDRLGGIDPATLWRRIRDGKFPKPVRLHGSRINLWPESQIDALIASEIAKGPRNGARPEAALAERSRRIQARKAARQAAAAEPAKSSLERNSNDAVRPNPFTRRAP